MGGFRDVLQKSLNLASRGDDREAVSSLAQALEDAIRQNERTWIIQLARNAAIISDHMGDLTSAERYYRIVERFDDGSPLSHFALGDLYKRMGREDLSNAEYSKCRELASLAEDEDTLELLRKVGFDTPDPAH